MVVSGRVTRNAERSPMLRIVARSFAIIVASVALSSLLLRCWFYCKTDPEYAAGYSRNGFGRVELGMQQDAVRGLLGEPLAVSKGDDIEVWIYSRQGARKTANYFGRYVRFGPDRLVASVEREFYID